MAIGDVRPQEQQEQDQPSSSTLVHPPTQDEHYSFVSSMEPFRVEEALQDSDWVLAM
jgi:hypothetical protein